MLCGQDYHSTDKITEIAKPDGGDFQKNKRACVNTMCFYGLNIGN